MDHGVAELLLCAIRLAIRVAVGYYGDRDVRGSRTSQISDARCGIWVLIAARSRVRCTSAARVAFIQEAMPAKLGGRAEDEP